MQTAQLQTLRQALSTITIPSPVSRPITVFDISGLSHHENTFSDWYQYFLQAENKYASVFIDSLCNLLQAKGKAVQTPSTWEVYREKTVETKRIDIVVESITDALCIVIENKIWAGLYNDLNTYSKYRSKCNLPPVGVLLTLQETTPSHSNFLNVTHKEWLSQITKRIKPDSSTEYFVLSQFTHAINNLYNDYTMNDQVNFFFQNRDQVIKAAHTLSAAKCYIKQQLTDVATNLGLDLSIARDKYFHFYLPGFKAAGAVVAIQDLDDEFDGGANIILQLAKEGIKRKLEFDELLRVKIIDNDLELEPWGPGTSNYLHYGVKYYDSESPGFYETIQETVTNDLVTIFIPMLNEMQTILTKKPKVGEIQG